MKLIVLYGPPAAGKLTIACKLAKLTSYKLFNHHLSIDLAGSIFPFGDPRFFRLSNKFRQILIETAAKENISGLIFTFCFAKIVDDQFIKKIIAIIKKYKGEIYFIHITCDIGELLKRVISSSRKKSSKISSVYSFKKAIRKWDLLSPISFVDSLEIDTTRMIPELAAKEIKRHFRLKSSLKMHKTN